MFSNQDGLEVSPQGTIGSGMAQVYDMRMPVQNYVNIVNRKKDIAAKKRIADAKVQAERMKGLKLDIPEWWDETVGNEIRTDVAGYQEWVANEFANGRDPSDPTSKSGTKAMMMQKNIYRKANGSMDIKKQMMADVGGFKPGEHDPKHYNDVYERMTTSKNYKDLENNYGSLLKDVHDYDALWGSVEIGDIVSIIENDDETITNKNRAFQVDALIEQKTRQYTARPEGQAEFEQGLIDNQWSTPEEYEKEFADNIRVALGSTYKNLKDEKKKDGGHTINFNGGGSTYNAKNFNMAYDVQTLDEFTEMVGPVDWLKGDRSKEQSEVEIVSLGAKGSELKAINMKDNNGSMIAVLPMYITRDEDGNMSIVGKVDPDRKLTTAQMDEIGKSPNPTEQFDTIELDYETNKVYTQSKWIDGDNVAVDVEEYFDQSKNNYESNRSKKAISSDEVQVEANKIDSESAKGDTPSGEITQETLVSFSKNLPDSVKVDVKDGDTKSLSITVGDTVKKLDLTNKEDKAIFDAINSGDKKAMNDFLFN